TARWLWRRRNRSGPGPRTGARPRSRHCPGAPGRTARMAGIVRGTAAGRRCTPAAEDKDMTLDAGLKSALALLLALCVGACATTGSPAVERNEDMDRARRAVIVLDEIMAAPDQAVPARLLADAHAIAVIPDVVKASLVLGGRHGRGLVSVRAPDGTWSTP